jgi:sterol desaturase/sphingolipid hydroxylase (fatty acid hydroxylase superfamily)
VKTDLLFMAVVQLAAPPLIGFVFTYALIGPARALDLPIVRLWPHGWPIWIQALTMILAVDFLRYWLHRAAHENETLWRLHSVHHAVTSCAGSTPHAFTHSKRCRCRSIYPSSSWA